MHPLHHWYFPLAKLFCKWLLKSTSFVTFTFHFNFVTLFCRKGSSATVDFGQHQINQRILPSSEWTRTLPLYDPTALEELYLERQQRRVRLTDHHHHQRIPQARMLATLSVGGACGHRGLCWISHSKCTKRQKYQIKRKFTRLKFNNFCCLVTHTLSSLKRYLISKYQKTLALPPTAFKLSHSPQNWG